MKLQTTLSLTVLGGLFACASQNSTQQLSAQTPLSNTDSSVTSSDRTPSSMIWEEKMPLTEIDDTTVFWYKMKIYLERQKSAQANAEIANRIAQAKLRGATCAGDFYYDDLINAYLAAVEGNPKVQFDSAVAQVLGQSFTYRVAEKMRKGENNIPPSPKHMSYYFENMEYSPEFMDGVYFEKMAAGAYGSTFNFTLKKDGTLNYGRLVFDETQTPDFKWTTGTGKWQLKKYDAVKRGRGKINLSSAVNEEWEKRGYVLYLKFDFDGSTMAYRLRYKDGHFQLDTRAQDFSKEEYKRGTFYSAVTGECDA